MSKVCVCSKDKPRKPVVISIGGKDETTGKSKEIEIVVCPHPKAEQPCDCGGKSVPGVAQSSLSEYATASEGQPDDYQARPSPPSSYYSAEGSKNAKRNTSSNPDQTFTKLPIVSPRYHGPGCVLEVSVMEKHQTDCTYKKHPNNRRNVADDKVGEYDVVGRMVFKTCNSTEESEYETTSSTEYESGREEFSAQVEMAQLIPLILKKSLTGDNQQDENEGSVSVTKKKAIDDLPNIMKKSSPLERLASSSKQFALTANASMQTPILASKEICTDDTDHFSEDPYDDGDYDDDEDDEEDDEDEIVNDNEDNEEEELFLKSSEGNSDISKEDEMSVENLTGELKNVGELESKKNKNEEVSGQKNKMQRLMSFVKKKRHVDGVANNVSTMTLPPRE